MYMPVMDAIAQVAACEVQDVVILGSGAFACEAMEAAVANNAAHVTLVSRERRRCGCVIVLTDWSCSHTRILATRHPLACHAASISGGGAVLCAQRHSQLT